MPYSFVRISVFPKKNLLNLRPYPEQKRELSDVYLFLSVSTEILCEGRDWMDRNVFY